MMVRERQDIIEMGSAYVNKMQKALELMNIKLKNVIDQIHGASGIKMIEAIIEGVRDPEELLKLCYKTIREKKAEEVKKALEGNYNPTWIFLLKQNLTMWKGHQQHLLAIDKKIESILDELTVDKEEVKSTTKAKPIRHHKPQIEGLHSKLLKLYGINVTTLSEFTDYNLLQLVGETGYDLRKFPTSKHFISWCQLSPRNSQSGKSNKRLRIKNKSQAGQIFREAAQSLISSKKIAIGSFMRRIRSKKGSPVAIKAGARKLAQQYYNLITKGIEYVENGVATYETKLKERELTLLAKLAERHHVGLEFLPA